MAKNSTIPVGAISRGDIVMATQVAGDLYESITGQLFEIGRQLRQPNGYPFNAEALKTHLQDAVEGNFGQALGEKPKAKRPPAYTRLISAGHEIILPPNDGSMTLARASEVFGYIDPDFVRYGCDVPGLPTESTSVAVREMTKNGDFGKIFRSLGNLDRLVLSQGQIIDFARNYRDWLRKDGYATFFLFKVAKFFVANVDLSSEGRLMVRVFRFEDDGVCFAEFHLRMVVPQLDTTIA